MGVQRMEARVLGKNEGALVGDGVPLSTLQLPPGLPVSYK